ncbi:MAG: HAMP domain-containing sensor histidine kinase [Polyangiaceae bacterium]
MRPYILRRRLLVLVSLLVSLALAGAVGMLVTALVARSAMSKAHTMELASRRAALLSVIVREQYIHEAHTIILRDRSHVGHHDEWVLHLDSELRHLRQDVAGQEAADELDAIRGASGELRDVFAREILTAIDAERWSDVARAHERANALVDEMTRRADALAVHFDQRATAAEQDAERLIRAVLLAALVLGCGAILLAPALGRSLWRSLASPLDHLVRVARDVEGGNRSARVPSLAAAELAVVGDAVNRMLDALRAAEADQVASERLAAIGRVAAGVAHEINNPIAVIRGYVKTMHEEAALPGLRGELAILDEEASACQRIAQDLLVYARSPVMERAPTDAATLLRDAAVRSDAEPLHGEERAAVQVEAESATLSVDPIRLRQVVVNLIQNARDASAGDPVLVRGSCEEDGYRIEVLDRGCGISDDARDRLFEPFFTTRRDGSGLGLAVCYGLISAHGGTIAAEPRPGGGSRFVVRLPGSLVEARP